MTGTRGRWYVGRIGGAVVGLALLFGSFAAASSGSPALAATRRARVVPAGFTDTMVARINEPIAMAATPDGRILVADQTGKVRVIDHGALVAAPALDISAKVCAENSERGLLGIALDPKFAANGFVYLYYTFKKFPKCQRDMVDVPVNRISRFTMSGNTISPSSEKILIDGELSYHGNHNAGEIGFGKDGMLYASIGDGGCDAVAPHACDPDNPIAQRTNTLAGKVVRITPKGGIPADNPFTGPGTARCNKGAIAPGKTCQEIDMLGFRNPFRFAFDPNAATTRLFVNDVGEANWEEVDEAVPGANYGWNEREGPCVTGSYTDCGPPPPQFTNPIFAYSHADTGCATITGGAFVPDAVWGAAYESGYFYGDYLCNKIFLLKPDGSGGWTATQFASGLAPGGPVALMFAPHGTATSLYYTTYTAHEKRGEVRVIDQN